MVKKWRLKIKYDDGHTQRISKGFSLWADAEDHYLRNYADKPHVTGYDITR